jgi:hypothetical protein
VGLFSKKKSAAPARPVAPVPAAPPRPQPPVVDGMQAAWAHKPTPPSPYERLCWSPLAEGVGGSSPVPELIFSEAIRPLSGDDEYADARALEAALKSATGRGLQHYLLDGDGNAVTTEQYNVKSAWIDPATGVIAAAAGLSHVAFGLPGALDLGLRDGRNMFSWSDLEPDAMASEFAQPHIGNIATRRLEAGIWTGQVGGITLSPDASRSAYVAWHAHVDGETRPMGYVFEDDLDAGTHRLVCVFEGYSGSARIAYSGDGDWLLVSESRPVLIRCSDGAHTRLPHGMGSAWAPSYGPNHLLSITGDDQADDGPGLGLRVLDLSTGEAADLGPLETVDGRRYLYVSDVDPHPQGGRALVTSPWGFTEPWEQGHGSRARVQVLDLEARRLTPITSPTVPGMDHLERDQRMPSWVADRRTGGTVALSDQLESELEPSLAISPTTEFVIDLARLQLQRCVEDLEPGRPTHSPAKVRVEVVRSLRAILAADPALGSSFVDQIREFVGPMSMQAILSGQGDADSRGMTGLGIGLQLLQEHRFDEYDWQELAYRR